MRQVTHTVTTVMVPAGAELEAGWYLSHCTCSWMSVDYRKTPEGTTTIGAEHIRPKVQS